MVEFAQYPVFPLPEILPEGCENLRTWEREYGAGVVEVAPNTYSRGERMHKIGLLVGPNVEGGRADVRLSVDLTVEAGAPVLLVDEIVNELRSSDVGGSGRAAFGAFQGILAMGNAVMDQMGVESVGVKLTLAEGDTEHEWERLQRLLGMTGGVGVVMR